MNFVRELTREMMRKSAYSARKVRRAVREIGFSENYLRKFIRIFLEISQNSGIFLDFSQNLARTYYLATWGSHCRTYGAPAVDLKRFLPMFLAENGLLLAIWAYLGLIFTIFVKSPSNCGLKNSNLLSRGGCMIYH